MTAQMRTGPAARDAEFRGIDPPALDRLIRQVQDAQNAIRAWLDGHRPPPGVPAAGYRQADQVGRWAADQLGMLMRRYNFAITHPDGGAMDAPPAPAPRPRTGGAPVRPSDPPRTVAPAPRRTTPRGAGDLGGFPDRPAAVKAARADALAVAAAIQDGRPVPESVWRHLGANAGDPDYTEKLYERLGPAATADLLKAAGGSEARLKVIEKSLATASHHMAMDVKWLRAFLAEADRAGVHPVAVQVLLGADLAPKVRAAVAKLELKTT
ncbi:hypothetical protein [Spirillospora albida]|uniref:hypothetical protein n=1 Tax=Spirillospora albida TaxID=58123 RepID=UPI0004C1A578|nr:hypothetical protein [Spirillospora albida]